MPNIRRTELALAAAVLLAITAAGHAQTGTPADTAAEPSSKSQMPKAVSVEDAKRLAIRNRDYSLDPLRTYRLRPGSGPNDANELLTGLRLLLDPACKLYLVPSQNVVMLRCNQEQLVIADQIVRELDLPKPNYRLTYTIAESENGKRIGVQHFQLNIIPGVRTTLKDGSKIPVATGSYSAGAAQAGVQTQFTYLDIGFNFDATLVPGADGLRLQSKVEQSSTEQDRTISGVVEPIVRQAVLEGSATLQVGKPLMLGTLDVAASTRHLEVEVLLEAVK